MILFWSYIVSVTFTTLSDSEYLYVYVQSYRDVTIYLPIYLSIHLLSILLPKNILKTKRKEKIINKRSIRFGPMKICVEAVTFIIFIHKERKQRYI